MSDVVIWHNPRCSKSRQTLAIVEDQGVEVQVRRYLDDAPSEAEIRTALAALGLRPIEMVRTKEKEFKAMGLTRDSADDALIAAMVKVPKLIERPIVFKDGKARLGRPPQSVLDLF